MPKIKYRFVDGKSNEYDATESLAVQYAELEHKERLVDRKETRRHQEFVEEHFISSDSTEEVFYQSEDRILLEKIISVLKHKDRALFTKHYIDKISMTEIAKIEGVTQSAISQRLSRIKKRIIELWQKS